MPSMSTWCCLVSLPLSPGAVATCTAAGDRTHVPAGDMEEEPVACPWVESGVTMGTSWLVGCRPSDAASEAAAVGMGGASAVCGGALCNRGHIQGQGSSWTNDVRCSARPVTLMRVHSDEGGSVSDVDAAAVRVVLTPSMLLLTAVVAVYAAASARAFRPRGAGSRPAGWLELAGGGAPPYEPPWSPWPPKLRREWTGPLPWRGGNVPSS